jgi:lipopolysaccharide transport system permease protein
MKSIDYWTISAKKVGIIAYLREIWNYRRLFNFLVNKILEKQYQKTLLGRFWLVFRPAIHVILYSLLFGSLLNVKSDLVPYPLFLIIGMSLWMLFDKSLMWGTRSLDAVQGILKKIYLPRLLVPMAAQVSGLIVFVVMMSYCVLMFAYYRLTGLSYFSINTELLASIISVILVILLAFTISLWTSVLDSLGRDMRYSLSYVMQCWMFITPITFPITTFPEGWRWIVELNPMTPLVQNFRAGLLTDYLVDWSSFFYPSLLILLTLPLSLIFFTSFENKSVDAI